MILLYQCLLIITIAVIIILIFKLKRIKRNIEIGIQILEDEDLYFTQEILIWEKVLEKLITKVNYNTRQRNTYIKELAKEVGNQKKILTSISHDLRTPLASLMGYLEMLNLGTVNNEDMQEYINVAYNKSVDLKRYIDNMFDWFKLSNSSMKANFDVYNVNELMRKIIIGWIPVVSKKCIEFSTDIPEYPSYIRIDENFFSRIMNNIINNAIVHSNCSVISVSVKHAESVVQIKIEDNGIGINKNEIKKIFDWLYTSDSTRKKGTGIGLNIVKMLVELQEGEIKVESRYGKGAAFILFFKEYKKS